jgi:uncharacterized membrane protein
MSIPLAPLHPQVVHFTIALLIIAVVLRLVSLTGWVSWARPAATTLLIVGTIALFFAVRSGDAAHGPVERIPGVRQAVIDHEEWAHRTHNIFLVVLGLDVASLALRRWSIARWLSVGVVAAGFVGVLALYQTAEHGGALVYSYAGGVGIRTGDPRDVDRLLIAGLYQQALIDRKAGRTDDAAALIDQAAKRYPSNVDLQLLAAESALLDRKDARGALAALDRVSIPADNRFLRTRSAGLRPDALDAAGERDAAIAVLQPLVKEYPTNTPLKQRLEQLKAGR